MKIKEILDKTYAFALILDDENKVYKFCSTLNYANYIGKDYIYLPILENSENIFEQIKLHLNNTNCKGFFIDKKILDEPENQYQYHKIMKEFSSKIEVIALVKNVFNSALKICEENMQIYSPKCVTIAGSEEKSVIISLVSYMLSQKGTTYSSISTCGPWQKFFEPVLALDETTKYCVIEIDPRRKSIAENAGRICKNNTVIFTKTSVNYTNLYENAQNYLFEITSVLDYKENIENIFTYEENDLVNTYIGQNENLNIISESQIKTQIKHDILSNKNFLETQYQGLKFEIQSTNYYMPRCATISAMCAKKLGVDEKTIKKCLKEYKDISGIYIENKLPNNNYSILSTQEHTHFSITNAIREFLQKYKDYGKILILSKITGLKEFENELHKDIIKKVAKENFETIVLIDMAQWSSYLRLLDKNSHIRKFSSKNNRLDEKELMDLGIFLKGKIDSNCAILVCTNPKLNLEFIF